MDIYVNLRCLQDPCYAFRGVGYHTSTLVRSGRKFFSERDRWIGLLDPAQPALPDEYSDLVDIVSHDTKPERTSEQKVFLETSPMTHDGRVYRAFLRDPEILSASLIYDFIPLDFAGRYLSNSKALNDYAVNLAWLNQYELAFPISQYSSNRLLDLVDIDPRHVHVTGVALRPEFAAILTQGLSHGLSDLQPNSSALRDYVLFVGGADQRKNLDVVLRAHAALEVSHKPQLLIVGNYPQRFLDEKTHEYKSNGGNPDDLVAKSGISDKELAGYYQRALCTVCSSEVEGFSLPPVEAICCGSAVFASRNDAHLELIDSDEALFDPHDDQRLGQLLKRAVADRAWVQRIAQRESGVAKKFLLERVAYRLWGPVTRRVRDRAARGCHLGSAGRRRKVAIMTPFPPDPSGVADYTRRSVEEIGKLVDVDIYCETSEPQATSGVRNFLSMSERPYLLDDYDQVVSVVGNSHFHIRIIETQMKYGGPVLIHDNRLAELYNWWKGPEIYRQMAERSLGRPVGLEESQEWIRDPGQLPSLFFDDLMPGARPLILHSRGIQRQVKQQYGIEADYLPFCIYREFPDHLLTTESRSAARARLGIPKDAIAIVTLGMVGPTKAPLECIEAISSVCKAGVNAHLYFAGAASGMEEHIERHAKYMNVSDRIHLCRDWLSAQQYEDFVVGADMAIQLRTHFFGGLSGAMLDCIASGLTTVANQDLAEAMEAPSNVLRISDTLSTDELANQLIKGATTIDLRDRLTAERQLYLEEHDFQNYAQRFVQVLGFNEFASARVASAA